MMTAVTVVEANAVECTAAWCLAAPYHPCIDYLGRPMGRFHTERRTAAATVAASSNTQPNN